MIDKLGPQGLGQAELAYKKAQTRLMGFLDRPWVENSILATIDTSQTRPSSGLAADYRITIRATGSDEKTRRIHTGSNVLLGIRFLPQGTLQRNVETAQESFRQALRESLRSGKVTS